jgi:hypothetical protein
MVKDESELGDDESSPAARNAMPVGCTKYDRAANRPLSRGAPFCAETLRGEAGQRPPLRGSRWELVPLQRIGSLF